MPYSRNAIEKFLNDPTDYRHGTPQGYVNLRCRGYLGVCGGRCREAYRIYMIAKRAEWRETQPLVPGDPRHGTCVGYKNHGCRCDTCRAAWNARSKGEKARKKHNKIRLAQLEAEIEATQA